MRGRFRKFNPDAIQHLYLRADDLGVIFYSHEDRIVYYTLSACNSKRHNVKVAAASLMFTHIHQSVIARTRKQIEEYIHDTNTSFARMYNFYHGRSGKLFRERPGMAQKNSSKDKRSNLIYVFNNQVEKRLCKSAVEERWDFLPYFSSRNPFSSPIDKKACSKELKRYIRLVDRRVAKNNPLNYRDLSRIFEALQDFEKEQFIDYVIVRYGLIDCSIATSLFGDVTSLVKAADYTSGSEYSINEEFGSNDDTPYVRLIVFSEKNGALPKLFSLKASQKTELIMSLFSEQRFDKYILSKFFHIPFD